VGEAGPRRERAVAVKSYCCLEPVEAARIPVAVMEQPVVRDERSSGEMEAGEESSSEMTICRPARHEPSFRLMNVTVFWERTDRTQPETVMGVARSVWIAGLEDWRVLVRVRGRLEGRGSPVTRVERRRDALYGMVVGRNADNNMGRRRRRRRRRRREWTMQ